MGAQKARCKCVAATIATVVALEPLKYAITIIVRLQRQQETQDNMGSWKFGSSLVCK